MNRLTQRWQHGAGWQAIGTHRRKRFSGPKLVTLLSAALGLAGFTFGYQLISWAGQRAVSAAALPPAPASFVPKTPTVRPTCQTDYPPDTYDNLHMSSEQCDIEFGPKLYQEISRASAYYSARGGITQQDAEDAEEHAHIRLKILNGQIFIKKFVPFGIASTQSRIVAIVLAVQKALLASSEAMPELDLSISAGDFPEPSAALWVIDRRADEEGKAWLYPDFGFYSWPEPWLGSWRDYRCRAREVSSNLTWSDKVDKLFWRGAILAPNREELVNTASRHEWGDAKAINWVDKGDASGRVSMEDHCRYRYLAQTEGITYSGRLKYLLLCSSVIVSHAMQYTQHFHPLFDSDPQSEQQNIVVVDDDGWSGLEPAMDELRWNEEKSRRIAENAGRLFHKYLSPAAEARYWRHALKTYAKLQVGQVSRSLQGWADLESVVLMRQMTWDAY